MKNSTNDDRIALHESERAMIVAAVVNAAFGVSNRCNDSKQAADEVLAACLGSIETLNRRSVLI